MKIVFYLPNKNLKGIDCTRLEEGNPGIGGTEYIIQATVHYLHKLSPKDINIILGLEDEN